MSLHPIVIQDSERYKAIVLAKVLPEAATYGLTSSDGIHWRQICEEPLIPPLKH